jgi:hypothetical protein
LNPPCAWLALAGNDFKGTVVEKQAQGIAAGGSTKVDDAKWVKGRQAGLDTLFTVTAKNKPPGVRNPNGQS